MTNSSHILILNLALPWLIMLLLLGVVNNASSEPKQYQAYIIHMDHSQKPTSFSTHDAWHRSTLTSLSSSPLDGEQKLLYTYNHVMHGFSAKLTPSQLSELKKSPAHRATYLESFGKLLTTRTLKFLGLKHKTGVWPASSYDKGVIIEIIDTGVWLESESFADTGMPPVPERWNGKCENGTAFSPFDCNKKLIGAQSFSRGFLVSGKQISKEDDFESAKDYHSYRTHTVSTAAGSYVLGDSHFGYARGIARGVAPSAYVAMYKVL